MTPPTAEAAGSPAADQPWHARPATEVLAALRSSAAGLSSEEAERRLARHGPNRLPAGKRRGPLRRLARQFRSLLIYVLLAAAVITALLGHGVDTAVILLVVVINALVGFVQEGRAEQALAAIRGMLTPHAAVLRDGHRATIGAEALVPGDMVLLEAGDRVPADLRLIHARRLQIDEAILTGESVPAEKATPPVPADAALADRSSMAFSGTLVTAGTGSGVVVATGAATQVGRISELLGRVQALTTPLLRQMDRLARRLTAMILALSALVLVFAVLARGMAPADAFMLVVGLAVAAIPEGLPAVLTIALAVGVQRMAQRNAIIRHLPAVETLGAVSVICTDKTGTLTRNEMTVSRFVAAGVILEVEGGGYAPDGGFRAAGEPVDPADWPSLHAAARIAMLCNDSELRQGAAGWTVHGDPMEGALIAFALKAGAHAAPLRSRLPRLDEIPFDPRHRYMATLHADGEEGALVCLKGAPEQVIGMCTRERGEDGDGPLAARFWHEQVLSLASEGQRVLALAEKRLPAGRRTIEPADLADGLTLVGLVGLIDPPRAEAQAAVRECRSAGIRVKMITGDHAETALAIARQLGLENDREAATGRDLARTDDAALPALAQRVDVFARTSPEDKLRLVQALQAAGAIVAMTGDGVNDAPALRRADVGIAMGRKGTEAAKEASVMVLADDNFASIAAAVREGRTVYDNLKKVIGWTLPTNGGEALTIIGALLLGQTLPLTPAQILWVNMVTATALGLTLAFEPPEPLVMRRPPRRPDEPLLSAFLLWRILLVSVLVVAGVFGLFAWATVRGLPLAEARTIAVNAIVVLEISYLFSVRYLTMTSFTWRGALGTRAVLIGVGTIVVLQLAFTYAPPMQRLFDTRALAFGDGLAIVGIGVAMLVLLELEKLAGRSLGRRRLKRA